MIFVPGNIVPYYLPGMKIQIFHGYAAEKKDHWVIRVLLIYNSKGPFLQESLLNYLKSTNEFLCG